MKTQLHVLPCWQPVLAALCREGAPTAASIQEAVVRELTRGHVTFASWDGPIGSGCRVTLHTVSPLPRYNRDRIRVVVGGGLYDPEIERRLQGCRTGDRLHLTVRQQPVDILVTGVEQQVIPPLTDDLVREQGVEGVTTVAQYQAWMACRLRRDYALATARRLVDRLLETAVLDQPDPEDVRRVIDLEFAPLRARFAHGGTDLDTLSPQEWKENFYSPNLKGYYEQIYPDVALLFDTTSKESFYQNRTEPARQTIRQCLILQAVLQMDGDSLDPTLSAEAAPTLWTAITDRICQTICPGQPGCRLAAAQPKGE